MLMLVPPTTCEACAESRVNLGRIYHTIRAYAEELEYPEKVDDYILEVEEGDGAAYWDAFDSDEKVRQDFRMWLENVT